MRKVFNQQNSIIRDRICHFMATGVGFGFVLFPGISVGNVVSLADAVYYLIAEHRGSISVDL